MNPRNARHLLLGVTLLVASSACLPDANRRERMDRAYLRLLAIEDARSTDPAEIAVLIGATADPSVFIRRVAVRALGRLERPELAPAIEPLLADPSSEVRAEAAHALAQAHHTSSGSPATGPLQARIATETDAAVRGALARALGRLTLGSAERAHVADLLVELSRDHGRDAPPATMTGVALGSEALVRGARGSDVSPRLLRRLVELTSYQGARYLDPEGDRIRGLALNALGQAGALRWAHVVPALRDRRLEVGASAVRHLASVEEALLPEALRRAVANESPFTVQEAYRFLATQPRSEQNCVYLFAAAQNPPPDAPWLINMGVRLTALDALAEACPDLARQRTLLLDVARSLDADAGAWRPATRALSSLSVRFPNDAAILLPTFAGHQNPFVRAHAAQAAANLADGVALERLLRDPVHNVRTSALQGLYRLRGHDAADVARAQLAQDDPQLVMTAARLLEGAPSARSTAEAALAAFDRMSAESRETWRDVRMALLERIGETGNASDSGRLVPYLEDYDPVVARAVEAQLERWTGRAYDSDPRTLPRAPLPTPAQLREMEDVEVVLHMREGGEIVIDLHPYVATTNSWRFYQMVRRRWFDGLTFHRWAPNFVIQGGSPHANEYYGDDAFTRDEVGPVHWRGTVGISTRGHDTGDGQIFVNLLDNVRLDHTYTIIGTVTEGLDVVDSVFEGAVIERAEVRNRR